MRVAVVGSEGQLGSDLVKIWSAELKWEVVSLPHSALDVRDFGAVQSAILQAQAEAVVNCAAYVRVDEAEDRPEEAFAVNAIGALNVARAAKQAGARCVYFSTDYVFDGAKPAPYTESDPTLPVNVYGASKLAGEHLTRLAADRWVVVRVASLYGSGGSRSKGGNFVDRIILRARAGETLRLVSDVRMSPTYTVDVAWALARWLEQGVEGIVHAANRGSATWFEFAAKAIELAGIEARLEPILQHQYSSRALRPCNSALASTRRDLQPQSLRPWEEALADYLGERGWLAARSAGSWSRSRAGTEE